MRMRMLLGRVVVLGCLAAMVRAEAAEPVWHAGHAEEMNEQLAFSGAFEWAGGAKPVLRVASSNPFRVKVNGAFVWYGPARGPKGFFRRDEVPLDVCVGTNRVEIECAGYSCASFHFQKQPSFLWAEVDVSGRIALRTSETDGPESFAAYRTDRVRKTNRYSHARTFGEAYIVGAAPKARLPLARMPDVPLLPRIVNAPDCRMVDDFTPVRGGDCLFDDACKVRRASFVEAAGRGGIDGYSKDSLVYDLWDAQQRFKDVKSRPLARSAAYSLKAGTFAFFDAAVNRTGFPSLTVECREPGELYVLLDEHPVAGDFKPWRSSVANALVWRFEKPGTYEVESFEPYVFKAIKAVARSGRFEISAPRLRLYRNADSRRASFRSSDPGLDALFAAAEETFAQNAVDGFMDCPGRERAGWNCDSFFTGRASALLTGNLTQETIFLDNFARPPHFDNVDGGMIPMCYPADFPNGNYIPSWAMFFVLQLEEYAHVRGGDPALVERLRPRVLALVDFLSRFRNSDGLLENLPRWVFVEWSKANDFVKGVNYPNNMIWAATLEAVDRLYGRLDLATEARRMKETIRRQSWNGMWFRDQALRQADGSLRVREASSETCQYYAFYFGTATRARHPELYRRLTTEFGPDRVRKGLYPDVWESAPFIGNFMRLDWLGREGLVAKQVGELKGYFGFMAARTGTLWENADSADNGSCCHGFASHVAVFLLRDVLGVRHVDVSGKTLSWRAPTDVPLDHCAAELPAGDGCLSVGWRRIDGRIVPEIALPAGWRLIEQ